MSHSIKRIAVGAVFALVAVVPAIAQPPGQGFGRGPGGGPAAPGQPDQIIVFSRDNYAGQTYGFTTSQERTPGGVVFGSVQVRGAWQLCSGPAYTGDCVTIDRDTASLQGFPRGVGSFRVAQGGGGRGGPGGPVGPQLPPVERGDNPSLRGNTAVFYPRPAERGFRIEVRNGDNSRGRYGSDEPRNQDVLAEANRFCRTTGFNRVSNADAEQANRRWYLSDVLCVRDDNNGRRR